ncbi:SHOCT domain-containing protein [Leuconostoc mesenteroides]|uniref:SHOCT domain-containing protein n=1 Tax=Leuconostoc mesenteroides TaxID=1245 RepID=UPI002360FE59|nr:SHOCT domain-containing protein [Leuconostoc mesenteroides]
MTKKMCAVCGVNKVGFLNSNRLSDGTMCTKCLEKIGLSDSNYNKEMVTELLSVETIKSMIQNGEKIDYKTRIEEIKSEKKQQKNDDKEAYIELVNSFKNKGISKINGFYFDNQDKRILIDKTLLDRHHLYKYSDLISYNPTTLQGSIEKHHGLTRAAVGGVMFGGAGAIVGAATGHKKFSSVSKMYITVSFSDGLSKKINFISADTKTNSLTYITAEKSFNAFIGILDSIIADNEKDKSVPSIGTKNVSDIENELISLKKLLDAGIITKEDFESKKKMLLGI